MKQYKNLVGVVITPNVDNPKTLHVNVSKSAYRKLIKNQNITGYKRFSVDLYDENLVGKNEFTTVKKLLEEYSIILY